MFFSVSISLAVATKLPANTRLPPSTTVGVELKRNVMTRPSDRVAEALMDVMFVAPVIVNSVPKIGI